MNRGREPHLRMPPAPQAPAQMPPAPSQQPKQQPETYPPQYGSITPPTPSYDSQQQWDQQPSYGYYPTTPQQPMQPKYSMTPHHNMMPPPPLNFDNNLNDPEPHALRPSSWRMLLAIIGLIAIAGGSWLAYYWSPSNDGPPVLIPAPEGPYKIKPESPGGAAVAYKDTLVYDRLAQYPHQSSGEQNVVILPDEPSMITHETEPTQTQPEDVPMQSTPLSHMNQQQPISPELTDTTAVALETPAEQIQPQPQKIVTSTDSTTVQDSPSVKPKKTAQQDMNSMLAKLSDIQELPSSSKQVYFLQMATLKSEHDATNEMKRLKTKLQLQQSKWHVRKSETAAGTLYALLLGPYKTREEAKKRCGTIKNGCTVVAAE